MRRLELHRIEYVVAYDVVVVSQLSEGSLVLGSMDCLARITFRRPFRLFGI